MRRRAVLTTFFSILALTAIAGVIDWPKMPPIKIGSWQKDFNVRLGLDLQGGTSLVYQADVSNIPDGDRATAMDSVRDVIERRVNAFGVSEPVVQTSQVGGQYRVNIDLAGVKDINDAIKQIGATPLLEFKVLGGHADAEGKKLAEEAIKKVTAKGADFGAIAKTSSEDTSSAVNGGDLGYSAKGGLVPEYEAAVEKLKNGQITSTPVKSQYGYHVIKRIADKKVKVDGKDQTQIQSAHILFFSEEGAQAIQLYKSSGLTGKQLQRSQVAFDPTTAEPQVQLQFNSEGTKLFADITKKNINKTVAIFLDGQPISTPVVNQEITSGTAVINGSFTLQEAKDLAQRLNAGALPVPISLISQQNIGASLGQASVERSLVAGLLGLILVAIFMIVFYRLPGLIAVIALGCYSLFVLAIFKVWPVTLTLAGIAGYILSIGMAVDANILVFERTKEELRDGRPLMSALEEGFRRAWLSIRDSNVSSLLTAFILMWFGTSLIKGFAVTLAIGIVVSMFTALTVTRTLMRLMVSSWMEKHLWLFDVKQPKIEEKHS